MTNSLHPATLSKLGLVSTLHQEVHDLSRETGWQLDFATDSFRLAKDVELALYRIIHEALTNVRKHANTDRVSVELRQYGAEVVVQVRDWGRGFAIEPSQSRGGQQSIGLFSMHRRAELLGGTCHIESSPGQGTTVTVKVPMKGENGNGHYKGFDC